MVQLMLCAGERPNYVYSHHNLALIHVYLFSNIFPIFILHRNVFAILYLMACRFIDSSKIYDIKVFAFLNFLFVRINSAVRSKELENVSPAKKSNPIWSTNMLHKICINAEKRILSKISCSLQKFVVLDENFKAFT